MVVHYFTYIDGIRLHNRLLYLSVRLATYEQSNIYIGPRKIDIFTFSFIYNKIFMIHRYVLMSIHC